MPEITGELLAKKAMEIRSDIPVIICTGHSAVIDEEIVTQIGVKTLLMKPLQKRQLLQTIRMILDDCG